mgnify:FL=1
MLLKEACDSIKLECALRDLGFVEIGWKTIAHAGIYFLEPIGMRMDYGPEDETLGFVMGEEMFSRNPSALHYMFPSAKDAFDMAEMLGDK